MTKARTSYLQEREKLLQTVEERVGREQDAGISLLLNIENFETLDPAVLRMAHGVGLYRTEFLFMGRDTFPSEEEQYEFYCNVLQRLDGREVTFRTIDVGGDKPLSYLSVPKESNPVLGWRGIRLTYEWPDLLIPQFRALLRASAHGPLNILLPMVTNVEEFRHVRKLLDRARDDLARDNVPMAEFTPLGIMIEVPAAALAAQELAEEADFLSVGTDDLGQYLFAVDRNNLQVSRLYQPLHPVMLRLLKDVIAAGKQHGRPVTVCGEMAGQPYSTLALLGLGLRRFSMSPAHVPEASWVLDAFSADEAEQLTDALIRLRTEQEIRDLLQAAVEERAAT